MTVFCIFFGIVFLFFLYDCAYTFALYLSFAISIIAFLNVWHCYMSTFSVYFSIHTLAFQLIVAIANFLLALFCLQGRVLLPGDGGSERGVGCGGGAEGVS